MINKITKPLIQWFFKKYYGVENEVFEIKKTGFSYWIDKEKGLAAYREYNTDIFLSIPIVKNISFAITLLTLTLINPSLVFFILTTDTTSTNNKDTYIDGYSKNVDNNYGTNESLNLYNYATWQIQRILLNFTLPSLSGVISDVKLYTYCYDVGSAQNTSKYIDIHQCLRNWTEAGATWNKYDGTNYWTTAGCGSAGNDYNSTIIDSINTISSANQWRTFVLMGTGADNPLTLNWGDTVNLFIKAKEDTTAHDVCELWRSKEYTADTTKRPYLEITYTSPSNFFQLF